MTEVQRQHSCNWSGRHHEYVLASGDKSITIKHRYIAQIQIPTLQDYLPHAKALGNDTECLTTIHVTLLRVSYNGFDDAFTFSLLYMYAHMYTYLIIPLSIVCGDRW